MAVDLYTLNRDGIQTYRVLESGPAPVSDHRVWLVTYANDGYVRHELYAHVGEMYNGYPIARGYGYFDIKHVAVLIHEFMGNRNLSSLFRLLWLLIRMVRL